MALINALFVAEPSFVWLSVERFKSDNLDFVNFYAILRLSQDIPPLGLGRGGLILMHSLEHVELQCLISLAQAQCGLLSQQLLRLRFCRAALPSALFV